jgi:hypothetical protein
MRYPKFQPITTHENCLQKLDKRDGLCFKSTNTKRRVKFVEKKHLNALAGIPMRCGFAAGRLTQGLQNIDVHKQKTRERVNTVAAGTKTLADIKTTSTSES